MRLSGACERAAHLVGSFELQPVAGALENLQLVRTGDETGCGLDGPPPKRGILVAPEQDRGCGDIQLARKGRPRPTAGAGMAALAVRLLQPCVGMSRSCGLSKPRRN